MLKKENKRVSIISLFAYTFCTIFLGGMFTSLLVEKVPSKPLVKIDVEINRTSHFLKILTFCENEGEDSEKIKLKMLVYKKGTNKNTSQIAQVKDLYLEPNKVSLPFITEINVKPEDTLEIILQVFDEVGNLLKERTFRSESL